MEEIFKRQILNLSFEGIEKYNNITEYEFYLAKVNVLYKDNNNDTIYLKVIKSGKIKESIFCFWSILYDEFLKNNKNNVEDIVQRAIITQLTSDKSMSSLLLTLNSKLNYCAEINLIELKNFIEKNNKNERWLDSLEIENQDILFIGKKLYK